MLEWTGERFIPGVKGDVEIEQLHRYHAACDLVRGLRVLDLACGEGDGSAILAGGAGSVVGVDLRPEAVAHARATHPSPRLRFEVGSAEQIPLKDASVDAVVCFETLEHVAAHDRVLAEFRRVLQPGGFLMISCPDRREHSEVTQSRNPLHLRSLYLNEFRDLLGRHFRNVQLYGQGVQYASMLAPLDDHQAPFVSFRSDGSEVVRGQGVVSPVHFLAVASDGPCPPLPAGVLTPQEPPFRAELESLRGALATSQADLARLGARLSEQEEQFRSREQEVRKLGAAGLSAQEARLNTTALELRQAARALDSERKAVADLQQQAQDLDAKLRVVWASRSWRLTAPLRKAMSGVRAIRPRRRLRRASEGLFIFTYRHLPFGNSTRVRLRNGLFRAFPWAFAHTGSFLGLEQQVQQEAVNEASSSGTAPVLAPPAMPARRPLPAADGVWEWADGAELRRRISDAETRRREELRVEPCEIISLQEGELDAAVADLQFPDCAQPLVTILIPTSGNLKSTVECLLSIARGGSSVATEVIVADDASPDGTAERLAGVPNLRVLPASTNQGYLRNVNRALLSARGRFVVLLDNDVQVRPGWLEALVAPALELQKVGAVGPKMLDPSGRLQEAGSSFRPDGTTERVGLDDHPDRAQYGYLREVDSCSEACLLVDTASFKELGGFDDALAPSGCEDSDLCLRLRERGLRVLYNPAAVVVHPSSQTTAPSGQDGKLVQVGRNLDRFARRWLETLDRLTDVRVVAFYLPQFHPIPENDRWWGPGFTEWRNVAQAQPNFVGHYQPRLPADLGFYDLRAPETADRQAALARRYGINAFCYYYYWFAGRRLLEMPLERRVAQGRPDLPFCLCWANENWTRRWDGQDHEILMAQAHSDADDRAVILDLIRYLRHPSYLRVNGKPLLAVYRVSLFPDFARTAATWRRVCLEEGLGEIYLAMVESFELAFAAVHPASFGCDAAIEFPPQGMPEPRPPSGPVTNSRFGGGVADYRDLVARCCLREEPGYIRFRGIIPGWDNTARRQDTGFIFENATPGAFEVWAETVIDQTRRMRSGDERLVFVNAWNEWAEGAYLEPDLRFGHGFLEALKNAKESALFKRRSRYALG